MKSNLDKLFKTDQNPVWFTIDDRTGFLVKPFNDSNPAVKSAFAKHFKPVAKKMEMGGMKTEEERSIMIRLFVEVCLVDWKGVDIDDKEDVKYDPKIAEDFFTSLPELFRTILSYAQDYKNYLVDREVVGNS